MPHQRTVISVPAGKHSGENQPRSVKPKTVGATSPAPLIAWSAFGKLALWAWIARSQWLSAYLTSISERPQSGQRTFSSPSDEPPAPQKRSVAVSTPTPEQVGQDRVLSRRPGVRPSRLIWSMERDISREVS